MHSGHASLGFFRTIVSTALLLHWCHGQEDHGKVSSRSSEAAEPTERLRGYLGVSTAPVPEAVRAQIPLDDGFGLSVLFVVPGGPVNRAGIRRHDILVSFGDQQLTTSAGLAALTAGKEPGDEIVLTALRKGKPRTFPTVLGDRRDAPTTIVPMFAPNLPIADLVSEFLDVHSRSPEVGFGSDGSLHLRRGDEHRGIEDLLNTLRRQPLGSGLTWDTKPTLEEETWISTPEIEVVITKGPDGQFSVKATHKKTGDRLYSGPLDPPEDSKIPEPVRGIIEDAKPVLDGHKGNGARIRKATRASRP